MKIYNDLKVDEIAKVQIDTGKDVYRFCVSDERINRNGWKILTAGINLTEYLNNPIVLLGHGGMPIGKANNIYTESEKLYADIWFHEQSEESKLAKKLVDLNVLSMTSVGINVKGRGEPIPIPKGEKDSYPPWQDVIEVYTRSELMEISLVPIPANPGAKFIEKLNNAFKDGSLNYPDWGNLQLMINNNENVKFLKEFNMILEESVQKIGRIEAENINITKDVGVLTASNQELKAKTEQLVTELTHTKLQLSDKELKLQSLSEETKTLKKLYEVSQKELVESQISTVVAELIDKILPVENNEQNNFKLKRDLIHLKINSDNLKDSDGKSLYEVKIAELKSRQSLKVLETPLTLDSSTSEKIDFKDFDLNDMETRKVLANKAKELSEKNKTTYTEELYKLIGE